MDNNNWRPIQGGEPSMDTSDWRTQLQSEFRQRIVNKIMDTLKKHLPFSGPEGLLELNKIAVRFEEKIYTAATSQSDYLRKISLKMLSMETKSQNTMANSLPSNSVVTNNRPPDQVSWLDLMDNDNWRPIQGGEPSMDTSDWRTQLQSESRQRIVNKIMDTLKKHLPFSGPEGLLELNKIAVRFEEKIYTATTSQSDYLQKISLKMLAMETKSQNTMANSLPSNSAVTNNRPPDQGSIGMPSQVHNQGQSLPMPMSANQSQTRQQLLSQNIQNSAGVQSSSSLSSALPPASSLAHASVPSVVGPNSNMQNMPSASQNSVGSMSQGVPSNMFARQIHGRQQVLPQQQQQQSQNTSQYLYQQVQHQLMKPNFAQANNAQSIMQSHMQQQQQNLLQPTQLQSSQQAVMQTSSAMKPSMMQSSLPSLQQSSVPQSTKSMLQQHQQPILRQPQQSQQASVHQQQTSMSQQTILPSQQQQQLMGQQQNATNMQQNHLIGQQNNVGDIDTEDDVKLLRGKGIILNHLKSDEEAANLWNGMTKSISLTKVPHLDKVIEDVNEYYNGRRKVKLGKFEKLYIFGSWQLLTLLAAVMLFLLMGLQAF